MDDAEITELALSAQAGDRAAAAAFVRSTQTQLHRLLTYLAGPDQAEDLVQETYLRAFAALPRFRAQSPARMWLFAIARRTVADNFRTAARRPRTAHLDDWSGIGDRVEKVPAPDTAVAIRQAIDALDPERREAFVLTQILGLTYEEAAAVCECAQGTIRSRVFRARDDLMKALDPPESSAEGPERQSR